MSDRDRRALVTLPGCRAFNFQSLDELYMLAAAAAVTAGLCVARVVLLMTSHVLTPVTTCVESYQRYTRVSRMSRYRHIMLGTLLVRCCPSASTTAVTFNPPVYVAADARFRCIAEHTEQMHCIFRVLERVSLYAGMTSCCRAVLHRCQNRPS
jgi:hypothetical protein